MSTRLLVLARTDRRLIRSVINAACPWRGYRDPREAQPAISRWPRTRYKDREPKGRENSCQEIVESTGDPRPGCAADNRRQHDGSEPELRIRRLPMHARLDLGAVRLLTRTGLDWTRKYPAIAAAIASLPARQAYPRCFNSLDAPPGPVCSRLSAGGRRIRTFSTAAQKSTISEASRHYCGADVLNRSYR